MDENLCEKLGRFRSWFYFIGVSDHLDVVFQLDFDNKKNCYYLFKFKFIWFLDDDFNNLVVEKWVILSLAASCNLSSMQSLVFILEKLKLEVQGWEREKNTSLDQSLTEIEEH